MSLLSVRKKYLQIAFNRSLEEVREMIGLLPASDKILVEAGTPLVKKYGNEGIAKVDFWWSQKIGKPGYVVADLKCMDRGSREVEEAARSGASATTCLGLAPVETIDEFIKKCEASEIDSMVDMLNVQFPFEVLQKLKKLPDIVVLHRGADENTLNREKMIPYAQINRIKGSYGKIIVSVAGAETTRQTISTFFNGANIAIVWRAFYEKPRETAKLAQDFLKLIK